MQTISQLMAKSIVASIKTDRLTLIPLDKSDFEVFQQINTDPFVRKHLWDDAVMPPEIFEQILNDVEQYFTNKRWGLWKLAAQTVPGIVGYAGLWPFFNEQQPQLLYALLPQHTRKGYAVEAAKRIIEYAFYDLKFPYLLASMDRENTPSVKVCELLGFSILEEKEVDGKPILVYRLKNTIDNSGSL